MTDVVSPGRVLSGRYRLERELARGGMATVWVAHDTVLARPVAVKIVIDSAALDESLRVRFRHEALAAARLAHPGIVATYDTGDEDGVAYIVMQLVDGPDLRRVMDGRGPLPVAEAVDIACQVAAALEHAHRRGLVHRDVKPANVLVAPDGVKVTDFGIAKAVGDADLTRTGTVVGTARYLAPEQVRGDVADARSDVYALGLVLYEMLTGTTPFGGDTELEAAMARLTTLPAPVRVARPEVLPALDEAVSRSLARDPAARFPSADALRAALEHADVTSVSATAALVAVDSSGTAAGPPGEPETAMAPAIGPGQPAAPTRRRWPRAAAAALVAAALAAGVVVAVRAARDEATSGRAAPRAEPVAVVSVTDFDPEGDLTEKGERADLVRDGDPATAWETETYSTRAFGDAKRGVGLVFELAGDTDVRRVQVRADDLDWSAAVYVARSPGDSLEAWGAPVSQGQGLANDAVFDLAGGARGRFVLLWFTNLPSDRKLNIAEVTIAG